MIRLVQANVFEFIRKNFAPFLLFFLVLVVSVLNYQRETILSGWDNLHPEFNFSFNLNRSIFAVWQEFQGLGLLGGMGHASDLFRQVILWMFSLIVPISLVRYIFHFSMLLVGALGIYFLLKDFVLQKYEEGINKWGSLAGAIFYLFNLGTLQMFYIPLEVFSIHFGLLPWLFWGVFRYLSKPTKKNLLLFVLINILSVAQGYVATVFLVYLLALGLVLLGYLVNEGLKKRFFTSFRGVFLVVLLTWCINAFWLLPNLYFVITSSQINAGAKINLMSTENNLLSNKKFGDLKNVMLLKGYEFDIVEPNQNGDNDYILRPWLDYFKKGWPNVVGYGLFALVIFGVFAAVLSKNVYSLIFLPPLLLGFTFLANSVPIFSFLANLIYRFPLFSQMYRFPFSKFSILVAFCLAIFYGVFVAVLVGKMRELKVLKVLGVTLILLPIIYLLPIFQGKLFYAKERAKIPSQYFQVFDFFKKQDPNTRIANFPQSSLWGWTMYDWGKSGVYGGSGFLWYGIKQPILDRAFDVWSNYSENYYWEISNSIYSKNSHLFKDVLEKYQVNWVLLDESVINSGEYRSLGLDELKGFLSDSSFFQLKETFGKIKIYEVNLQTTAKNFVFLTQDLPTVNEYKWGNEDKAFVEDGHYVSLTTNHQPLITPDVYYPFRSLFTGRSTQELDFKIEDLGDRFVFRKDVGQGLLNYELSLPSYDAKELVFVDEQDLSKVNYYIPEANFDGRYVEVSFPKVKGYFSADINPAETLKDQKSENCNKFSNGKVGNEIVGGALKLQALDATNCSASFWLPNLPHSYSYLISTETKNISGKNLLFWLENLTNRKGDIELYLEKNNVIPAPPPTGGVPLTAGKAGSYIDSGSVAGMTRSYLIQPPMAEDGLGYSLHFDNISIGRQPTVNELGKIEVNLIPYKFLTGLRLVFSDQGSVNSSGGVNVFDLQGVIASHLRVEHPNPSVYEIEIDQPIGDNETLVLSQAYSDGWKAYVINSKIKNQKSKLWKFFPFWFGEEIKDHVLVNNWENGWKLSGIKNQELEKNQNGLFTDSSFAIILIFWPQYLEYLGFGVLLICGGVILLSCLFGRRRVSGNN